MDDDPRPGVIGPGQRDTLAGYAHWPRCGFRPVHVPALDPALAVHHGGGHVDAA